MPPRRQPQVPTPGIYAPALTLFDHNTDTLDLASQRQYFSYLHKHLTGLVILGTNAETFLLTRAERASLLQCARQTVGPDYPLIAGVGGHSTKQVLEYISDAVDAGMDYVLVLPAAYFGKATSAKVVSRFFDEVATKSPLPVILYNFPGVCNGVDLESEAITALARRHENVVGVKLTCASVGKLTRLCAELPKGEFATFGGQSDFLLGGLAVGSAGCIAAFANVFPKAVMRIYRLWGEGRMEEALALHRKAALAESLCKSGIASTKFAAALTSAKAAGIEGAEEKLRPRTPYEPVSEEGQKGIRKLMEEMVEIENSL